MKQSNSSQDVALFVSAFIDELIRCGVGDVVISPGSRSTPLAMVAYASRLTVHVDIDERGAAFFALGLAKASGRPVCLICTSGTAVANYYPAIVEAECSRIPLIVTTGDRPPLLQNLGAPQTFDQLNAFGSHVRHFQQMPLPGSHEHEIAFARQMAIEAFSRAVGSQVTLNDAGEPWYGCISDAGPVHLNFPFEKPLTPDLDTEALFEIGRSKEEAITDLPPVFLSPAYPDERTVSHVDRLMRKRRVLVICGEGTCVNQAERHLILAWAQSLNLPLLADPLSNLRSSDSPFVIDGYDAIFRQQDCPTADVIIRFGRWPVSKSCFSSQTAKQAIQIVVDAVQTRDFNSSTDLFIKCTPAAFVAAHMIEVQDNPPQDAKRSIQSAFAHEWIEYDNEASETIVQARVEKDESEFEGSYIRRLFELVPDDSCVFSASSMTIRLVDTFYKKSGKNISVLCNRGLNGIDGCTSSAIGAAHCYRQTTLLIGDLAFLHDLSALSLQHEIMRHETDAETDTETDTPALIIVVLNNEGGAIFEMLPQQSEDPYFERLFITPQNVELSCLAQGFTIPFAKAKTLAEFTRAYRGFLGKKGLHIIEIPLTRKGLKEHCGNFLA